MSDQQKFNWLEAGTTIPLYTVYAKTEKQALKKLSLYLAKIGKSGIELIKVADHGETPTTSTKVTGS